MGAVLIKLKTGRLLKVHYFDRHGEADGGGGGRGGFAKQYTNEKIGKKNCHELL